MIGECLEGTRLVRKALEDWWYSVTCSDAATCATGVTLVLAQLGKIVMPRFDVQLFS